uniref:Ig-like domain-containing protein n=1 Tax=Monodelphis domestica TaxID=13616 RepID=A0A5F8HJ25_MONDO
MVTCFILSLPSSFPLPCILHVSLIKTYFHINIFIQTPWHLITRIGQKANLRCEQYMGHDTRYWYRQNSKMRLQMMFFFSNTELIGNETASSRFKPETSANSLLDLYIESLQLEDTATYLCASSLGTEL